MKTYIQPQTSVIRVEPRNMLLNISIVDNRNVTVTNSGDNVGLVKENRTTSNHSVWDDDWSQ